MWVQTLHGVFFYLPHVSLGGFFLLINFFRSLFSSLWNDPRISSDKRVSLMVLMTSVHPAIVPLSVHRSTEPFIHQSVHLSIHRSLPPSVRQFPSVKFVKTWLLLLLLCPDSTPRTSLVCGFHQAASDYMRRVVQTSVVKQPASC